MDKMCTEVKKLNEDKMLLSRSERKFKKVGKQ